MATRASLKPANAETAEDVLDTLDKQREANLRIWNALGKTDPAHTKQFSRAGGFKGTAIKPIWITQRLTEQFGPCGEGWGFEKPEFQIVDGVNDEKLVYCTVTAWYAGETAKQLVYGVGGDKIVSYIKANQQYNRPERWENDDEAFKKAFTDALGNAFKFVGVGADVHMGLFEDSKYLAEVTAEFQPKPEPEDERRDDYIGPKGQKTALKERVNGIMNAVRRADSNDAVNDILKRNKETIERAEREWPALIEGDLNIEGSGLKAYVKRRRQELQGSLTYQLLCSTLGECDTAANLREWMKVNGDRVADLDGEESRKFEAFYDEKAASLKETAA